MNKTQYDFSDCASKTFVSRNTRLQASEENTYHEGRKAKGIGTGRNGKSCFPEKVISLRKASYFTFFVEKIENSILKATKKCFHSLDYRYYLF